jgi:hypothetical protein
MTDSTATRSLKDAVKAITTTFSGTAVPSPLPEELQQTVEAFLNKHQNIEETESERLHDELLSVYHKYVESNAEKHGAFVGTLRLLRPAITGEKRLREWWELVVKPTVDAIGHKRDTIEDAKEFLLGILVYDADEDPTGERAKLSNHFTKKILDSYLARTKIPSGDAEVVSPEDEFVAHDLESILVAFGRKMPKVRARHGFRDSI